MFFVNGAAIGVWVAQIPFVQQRFDLSKSTLGLILLTMSIGVIVALPVIGQAIVRLGSARAVRLAGTVCCLLVPLPLLAPEPYLLPLALIAFGAAAGSMDVSMNAHGSAIERRLGRPIMSSLHAGWSFGGFAGRRRRGRRDRGRRGPAGPEHDRRGPAARGPAGLPDRARRRAARPRPASASGCPRAPSC